MTRDELKTLLQTNRCIYAVKDEDGLRESLKKPGKILFVLFGNILSIASIVHRAKEAGKTVFVHVDLIDGLFPSETAITFLARHTGADGIISTKQSLIKSAATQGLLTVQRFFLIDSMSMKNLKKQLVSGDMDVIEILPAFSARLIPRIREATDRPVIASGLISSKDEMCEAILAGAAAVSGTDCALWE